MQRFLGIILFFILLVGCKSDRPSHVLKEKEMTDLLLNLHLAEAYLNSWSSDSSQKISGDLIEGVYQHYNTDSTQVRASLEFYAGKPQMLDRIYQTVDTRLKEMETNVREIEEKKYRDIFVKDSISRAMTADSLLKIQTDSINYQNIKHLLYWKDPDSTDLKPVMWDWNRATKLHKRYFNYPDSVILRDSLRVDSAINLKDTTLNKAVQPVLKKVPIDN